MTWTDMTDKLFWAIVGVSQRSGPLLINDAVAATGRRGPSFGRFPQVSSLQCTAVSTTIEVKSSYVLHVKRDLNSSCRDMLPRLPFRVSSSYQHICRS